MTRSLDEKWIPDDTFGDRLRRIRRSLKLGQEEFATLLGPDVGAKALGTWEAGTREPRGAVTIAKRVELAFGVPASWLLGLDVPLPDPVGPFDPTAAGAGGTDRYGRLVAA